MSWVTWPCPLCGANEYGIAPFSKRRDEGGRGAVAICKTCGMTPYVGETPPRFDHTMRHEYYEKQLCSFDWTHKKKISTVEMCLDDIERFRPLSGSRVLDVGCGQGILLEMARRRGAIVHGVEPSVSESQKRRDAGTSCFTGFVHEFQPAEGEAWDIIILSWTLDSMMDPVEGLRACRRLIAPDGLLVLNMGTMFVVPFFKWVPGAPPHPSMGPMGHYMGASLWPSAKPYTFTPASLAACLRVAGFDLCWSTMERRHCFIARPVQPLALPEVRLETFARVRNWFIFWYVSDALLRPLALALHAPGIQRLRKRLRSLGSRLKHRWRG
jgi:SAM-dependent methyltransferase